MHDVQTKKLLDFIKKFIKQNGYSPSYREMAQALNVNTSTTRSHIIALQKRGFIKFIPGTARSVGITHP